MPTATAATDAPAKGKQLLGPHPLPHKDLHALFVHDWDYEWGNTRRLRCDRIERDTRAYDWIIRRTLAEHHRWGGSGFQTTWREVLKGAFGIEVPEGQEVGPWSRRVRPAFQSLQEHGLIAFGGVRRANGQWKCLRIRLIDSPDLYSRLRRSERTIIDVT